MYEDHDNRPQIAELLRYYSSKSGEDMVSLREYCARMRPGQTKILYVTGRNRRDAARSPYIEAHRREGFEVIYMTDPVDEYAIQFLRQYEGHAIISCMTAEAAQLLDACRMPEIVR